MRLNFLKGRDDHYQAYASINSLLFLLKELKVVDYTQIDESRFHAKATFFDKFYKGPTLREILRKKFSKEVNTL